MSDIAAPKQPLGVGALFGETISLFFRRFLLFFTIAAVPTLFSNAIALIFLGNMMEQATRGEITAPGEIFTPAYFVFLAFAMVLAFLMMGVMTMAAYDAKLKRPITIMTYVSRTITAVVPIIILAILFYLLIVIGLVLLVLPALYLGARYGLFVPAILIERAGFKGLGRSSELTRNYRWPIALCFFLILVFMGVFSFAVQAGVLAVGISGSNFWIVSMIQGVLNAVPYAFASIFTALLFARMKEIKEGTGIDTLVEVFS